LDNTSSFIFYVLSLSLDDNTSSLVLLGKKNLI
jgi:hypothetical protein